MSNIRTNFKHKEGGDLGDSLVSKEYIINLYPEISDSLKTSGLWVWGGVSASPGAFLGLNRKSTPTYTASGSAWKKAPLSYNNGGGIKNDGTLWMWGDGFYGKLGVNSSVDRVTPVTTFAGGSDSTGDGWKDIAVGDDNVAAIKNDGTLWTWGNGGSGRLGNADTASSRSTPVTTFIGGNDWKKVVVGDFHVAAIKNDGTLWTWGNNVYGQLGDGTTTNKSTPVTTFAGGNNWKYISAGIECNNVAAIKTDGTLWTWGEAANHTLGIPYTVDITDRLTPVTTFVGGTDWSRVSIDDFVCIATKTDGTLWSWGYNYYSGLGKGLGYTPRKSDTPVTTFAGGTNWANAAAGAQNLYTIATDADSAGAIKTDGTLWVWGRGSTGILGIGDYFNRLTPVTTFAGGSTANGNGWKSLTMDGGTCIAVKTNGTLWVWGSNTNRVLGIGDTSSDKSTPVTTFAGGTNWVQASINNSAVAAVKIDGTLWVWGSNANVKLGINTNVSVVSTPVTTFAGGTTWSSVSCGGNHMAAIKTDGIIWTWGYNFYGQLGINTEGTGSGRNRSTPVTIISGSTWAQLSCGNNHTVAIKSGSKVAGELWGWGDDFYCQLSGQAGLGNNTNTPISISAGSGVIDQVFGTVQSSLWLDDLATAYFSGNNDLGTFGQGFNVVNYCGVPRSLISTTVQTCANTSSTGMSMFLRSDGTLWVMGSDLYGQMGINQGRGNHSIPDNLVSLGKYDWRMPFAFYHGGGAMNNLGSVWMWGYDSEGQLGFRNGFGAGADDIVSTPRQLFYNSCKSLGNFGGRNFSALLTEDDI